MPELSESNGLAEAAYTVFEQSAAGRDTTRSLELNRALVRFNRCKKGLHHAGVEFRSLSEDFDTATANGKLQLQMVLAFSEWWRNSIRERSVGGQAKARTEGRFPGRRPVLTQQQRECIREERSKGVSQRELAKRLEVSRWTIQQVDR